MLIRPPVDRRTRTGGSATLSVIASGGGPMVYQWYQRLSGNTNAPIVGATNTSFTTPSLSTNADFWVSVQDSAGSTNSTAATVRVYPTNAVWLDAQMISGVVNLSLDGIAGATYRIGYSQDAVGTNWTTLTNVALSANPFTFIDAGSTNSVSRFYRALAP
ncbi:MAG: Ig-like domain-containing protein [Limisphaerales bacterium]